MIKLTSAQCGKDIYINEELIMAIFENGSGDIVVEVLDDCYAVKESASEILEKIAEKRIIRSRGIIECKLL